MSENVTRLRDLTPVQRRSGLAAWLGWLFDGLDMHIYTLVATPFVAQLLHMAPTDKAVGEHGALINAGFLVGWALGGAVFGRIGDLIGRSRTLMLTIITYAGFTGLSAVSQEWWHLLIFRFLSALGIGGEWAVGASLLSETWPKKWRPWIAATLQSAVNIGILLACAAGAIFANHEPRWIFLVGVLPALLTLWIRKAVPETETWAHARGTAKPPGLGTLFGPAVRSVTWRALIICAVSLTAHWAFMFWQQKYIRELPDVVTLTTEQKNLAAVKALTVLMLGSICGNYLAGFLALRFGYRRAIAGMFFGYFVAMAAAFSPAVTQMVSGNASWTFHQALAWFAVIGALQGVFGLFTMCLPPLFPTLLRTTGAGFCYNIGRIAAAGGTVFFGIFQTVSDVRPVLLYAAFLFIPATVAALFLPEREHDAA